MTLRDIFLENSAGDLEYHPRRAVLYFVLAVATFCFWFFLPTGVQFTTIPLVFALGGLALLIKGIFLMRKSSEGLGLSDQELPREKMKESYKSFRLTLVNGNLGRSSGPPTDHRIRREAILPGTKNSPGGRFRPTYKERDPVAYVCSNAPKTCYGLG